MSEFHQLTGLDCAFLFMESPEAPMNVGGIYLFDGATGAAGKDRLAALRQFMKARLSLAAPLHRVIHRVPLDVDQPYWVDADEIDVDCHIARIGDGKIAGWNDLRAKVVEFYSAPLEQDRPLWRHGLIDRVTGIDGLGKDGFVLMTKVHHAAIDGAAGVDMERAIFATDPEAPPPMPRSNAPSHRPTAIDVMRRMTVNSGSMMLQQAKLAAGMTSGLVELGETLFSGRLQPQLPNLGESRFNRQIDASRSFGAIGMELAGLQAVRKAIAEVTVNDLVLAIVGGALHKYARARGDATDVQLSAMVPVSIRKTRGSGNLGNEVANMSVSLGNHIADPLHRVINNHDAAKRAKDLLATIGPEQMLGLSNASPAWLASPVFALFNKAKIGILGLSGANIGVTNVPGSPVPLYMDGERMVRAYSFAPIAHGFGLMHTVFSYAGMINIAFNVCATMMPDPEVYEQCLAKARDEVLALDRS